MTRTFAGEAALAPTDHGHAAKRLEINFRRNAEADHTAALTRSAQAFCYDECRDAYWQPERWSLLWGTPLWDEASAAQRLALNHLYWAAYYSQIISAEIATIYFNQTSAAGLFGIDEFSDVCRMLDLESTQEREHIAAFKRIAEDVEHALLGERVFTFPMRGPFAETMLHVPSGTLKRHWRSFQLRAFGLLSSGSAFTASQYFLIRGLRTLKGKIVQHELGSPCRDAAPDTLPRPTQVSHYHYLDESYHFNSSTLISQQLARGLPTPTRFERALVNAGVRGCQRDHSRFSTLVPGIFWHDPGAFRSVYSVLTSSVFGMEHREALAMIRRCFTETSEGMERSAALHRRAQDDYRTYAADVPWLAGDAREMRIMARASVPGQLIANRRALSRWERSFS